MSSVSQRAYDGVIKPAALGDSEHLRNKTMCSYSVLSLASISIREDATCSAEAKRYESPNPD